jgi:hypothetical protein
VSQSFNAASRRFRKGDSLKAFIARNVRGDLNTLAGFALYSKRPRLSLVVFNERVRNRDLPALPQETLQELTLTLDHEIGHLVIPDALNDKDDNAHGNLIQENVADAFALLMHYKRFGLDTPLGTGSAMLDLAESFAFKDKHYHTHFCYPMIMKIVAVRHLINFDDLSPADIAKLARSFALQHTFSNAQIRDLDEAFTACRKAYRHRGTPAALRSLAHVAQTTQHPHVARVCVDMYMDLHKKHQSLLQAEEWSARFHDMERLDLRLTKEELLFRIPSSFAKPSIPQTPPPPAP